MKSIHIQKATQSDLVALQEIGRRTFSETFAADNTAENLSQYLSVGFSAEKLTAELNNPESEFYLARLDKQLIGYLKVNWGAAQSEAQDPTALEIERIYVLQAFHGTSVGQQLYDLAYSIAQRRQATFLWLGVWEKNPRAIRFYQKQGFVEFGQHIFQFGDDAQTDILMKKVN